MDQVYKRYILLDAWEGFIMLWILFCFVSHVELQLQIILSSKNTI